MYAAIYIALALGILYVVNRFAKSKGYSNKKSVFLGYFVLIVCIATFYGIEKISQVKYGESIGAFFEKSEYEAKYYVNVFEDDKFVKNYRLVADILRYEGEYRINYLYWPNGGSIPFENNSWHYTLSVGEKVKIKDDNDKTWYIELTKEKVE